MFDAATVQAVERIAVRMNVDPKILLAVAEVESAGHVFARVNGRLEPLIRFEGHYFDRRLTGAAREQARAAGLAHPQAGKVKSPNSQAARWQMLVEAARIDKQAALESISIGLGQVMVAHWAMLGFASPAAMVAKAREGAAGQIEVMALYIERFGLADELQRRDFTAFARGYNGPGFAKHGYHTKIAAAYQRLSGRSPVSQAGGMLRMGSKGARVRELQALLVRAGYAVNIDGDYGPATKQAVSGFQRSHNLSVDGVAGPETLRALSGFKIAPDERPGELGPLQTEEAREGAAALLGAGGVETARQAFEGAAAQAGTFPGLEWLSAILTLAAVALMLGGLAWGLYGWLKSRRTDEGDVVSRRISLADILDLPEGV